MMNPLLSIIIPVYNRVEELERSIKSCLKQTYQNFEIIVIDDCSEMDTHTVVTNFKDNRISYHKLSIKGNAYVARNYGAKQAKGDFIFFLDSDDEYMENHLERYLKFFSEHKTDGIFSGIEIHRPSAINTVLPGNPSDYKNFAEYILNGNLCSTPTFAFKKEQFLEVLFDEKLPRHQDWDLGIRFAQEFYFMPNKEVSVIVNWPQNNKRVLNIEASKLFFEKHGSKISKNIKIKYFTFMYQRAVKNNESKEVTDFYKNQIFSYGKLNKNEFFTYHNYTNNLKNKIFYNFAYYFYKLFLK